MCGLGIKYLKTWLGLIVVLGSGEAALAQTLLFNSVQDQSGPQGANNFWYGYYSGGVFTTNGMVYSPASTNWSGPFTYSTPYFQVSGGRHPGGQTPVYSAVQRWSNSVERLATFSGHIRKTGSASGNGVVASVRVNGVTVWANRRPFNDSSGNNFTSIVAYLPAGSWVDLVLDPIGNYDHDASSMTIEGHELAFPFRLPIASSANDFQGEQSHTDLSGRGYWRYGHYTTSASPATFTTNGWSFSNNLWNGPGTWHRLSRGGGHSSDLSATTDVVRRWTSQTSGTLVLQGNVVRTADNYNLGDGIITRVYHNTTLLHSRTMGLTDINTFSFVSEVTVQPGDTIDVAVNRNVSSGNDGFGSVIYLYRPFQVPSGSLFFFR